MRHHAKGTFEVKGWDEAPYEELGGKAKLTRASVKKTFQGDVEGEGTLEYLMAYTEGGRTTFVGIERIVGKLSGRAGSFVLQHNGHDEGGAVKVEMVVVPGSGTGQLLGLRGTGSATLSHAERYPFTLDYELG